jgi:hypothetical protein
MIKINKEIAKSIKRIIFQKADKFGFTLRSRNENGHFMDELVETPEIGGVLIQYMPKERIRTYIKDGVLNSYTKQKKYDILLQDSPDVIIKSMHNKTGVLIQEEGGVSIFRLENGKIFLLSKGTVLKWETALRKALDTIAKHSNLTATETHPEICLHLAVIDKGTTGSGKAHIKKALAAIKVKIWFTE